MRILDFRFQISDIRSRPRRGVTILEVLFAILVTAVGLMGALTLLPVAAGVARKARTADASASAVTAAVGYFDAMGMRRPQSWVAYDAQVNGNPTNTGNPRLVWTEYQAFLANPTGPQPPIRRNWFGGFDSFCIDPRMTAANQKDVTNPALGVVAGAATFPRNVPTGQPAMWRLGLSNGGTIPMNQLLADSVFVFDDDLNFDRVTDSSIVASQAWNILPADAALPPASQRKSKRQIEGRLSWMATLVPKIDRYSILPTDTYVLSIVVFHDRPASLVFNADPLNERRLVVASMPGNGITGGEVLLRTLLATNEQDAKKELNIHTNEWILLAGTVQHADVDPFTPGLQLGNVAVFKWYRVSDIEAEVTWNGTVGERYVTLMGQDWDTTMSNIQAVAMEGVVAVVEKTIRLEP